MTSPSFATWVADRFPEAPPIPMEATIASLRVAPGEVWSADAVGPAYERSLAEGSRRTTGAFYTRREIADGVVARALPDPLAPGPVCDPAVGGGAFLLAAARRLEHTGASRREIVERWLHGIDIDSGALEATAVALAVWAGPDEAGWADPRPHLIVADTIATDADELRTRLGVDGFLAVVGNPPFLGQLRAQTRRGRAVAARVDAAAGVGGAYTDAAALFLLVATRLTRPGGRVALLLPESVLSARDASGVRSAVLAEATVEHLWVAGEPVFSAATRVCAPVLRRAAPGSDASARAPRRVSRSVGPSFRRAPAGRPVDRSSGGSWGHLVAGLHGVPAVDLDPTRTLGEWAEATAGFRQQFYGIQPFVLEGHAHHPRDPDEADADERPWLVTSGSIDPLVCRWGDDPTTFGRVRWAAPRVDLAALADLDPTLHRWAMARLRPKVVVASQTRVIEAAVDVRGRWYPSTPTVAVQPRGERLWSVAAVLCAPPVSAWLHGRLGGSALAAGHLRVTASALRDVPLPPDGADLDAAVALARRAWSTTAPDEHRAVLLELGRVMTEVYGAGDGVYEWWAGSLPGVRRSARR